MIRGGAEVPEAALADLRAVGFPLLEETESERLIRVTNFQGGMEGLIHAKHFLPIGYDLSYPLRAIGESRRHLTNSMHFRAIIESYLGPYGLRLSSVVINELILTSAARRQASCAVTALRIVLDQELEGHLEAAIWDDAEPYQNPDEIIKTLSQDSSRTLGQTWRSRASEVARKGNDPLTVYAMITAVRTLGGGLSAFSAGNRVSLGFDVEAGEFEFDTGESVPTAGNLITMSFPHHSKIPTPV